MHVHQDQGEPGVVHSVSYLKVNKPKPLVSYAFLQTRPDQCTPIREPKAYATPGYYPSSYCVRYDAATSTYRVALEGLVYRGK